MDGKEVNMLFHPCYTFRYNADDVDDDDSRMVQQYYDECLFLILMLVMHQSVIYRKSFSTVTPDNQC